MDTKVMSQFEVMDEDMLTAIEGGGIDWGKTASCAGSIAMGWLQAQQYF